MKKEIIALFDKGCETKSYLDKAWDLASQGQKVSITLLYPSYDR